jgi:hypothetical protein
VVAVEAAAVQNSLTPVTMAVVEAVVAVADQA